MCKTGQRMFKLDIYFIYYEVMYYTYTSKKNHEKNEKDCHL